MVTLQYDITFDDDPDFKGGDQDKVWSLPASFSGPATEAISALLEDHFDGPTWDSWFGPTATDAWVLVRVNTPGYFHGTYRCDLAREFAAHARKIREDDKR